MTLFASTSSTRPRRRPTTPFACEPLEPRALLAASAWTAGEVYLAELVNRARLDPMAEAARLGIDLTQALTSGELARLHRQEPLALNMALTLAARAHSRDMATRAFFSHINPDGLNPTDRAVAAGYFESAGENIAAGYADIDAVHKAWLQSLDHRKNVLSLYEDFDDTFHYDEFGAGIFLPSFSAPYTSYYTQEFGYQGANPKVYLLGVLFDDTSGDSFYTPGEGLAGVRVDVYSPGNSTAVATYTTDAAGNYQIALEAGTYTVVFTNTDTGLATMRSVTIGDENIKQDATKADLAYDLSKSNVAAPDAVPNASANFSDQVTVTTRDPFGNAIVFRQGTDGHWSAINLTALTGSPKPSGEIVSWTDWQDGSTMAAAPSADGLLIFRFDPGSGQWTFQNVTAGIAGAKSISGALTTFVDLNGIAWVAGLTGDGDLVAYSEVSTETGGDWYFSNITQTSLAPNGQNTPAFVGGLVSYVTQWNGLNIVGLDSGGNIQAVWWAPGLTYWRHDDLSQITGAPVITGGLTAYLTSWGGINIGGVDWSGQLTVTWWVPDFGGNWVSTNLTEAFAGPTLIDSSVSSYVTAWGGLNVTGLDSSGKVVVYWWAPGLESWSVATLSDSFPDAGIPSGAVRGVTSYQGTISLLGIDDTGHVIRYWWAPGGTWQAEDLSALT